MTIYKALIPHYVMEFKCIGPQCERNCCAQGWKTDVDKDHFLKYKKIVNREWKDKFQKYVKRNRQNVEKQFENLFYAKIHLDEKGKCSFLSENMLCTIQSEIGCEYLCRTCSMYPREFINVDGVLQCALTTACPEAARKMLLNKDAMQFDFIDTYEYDWDFNCIVHTNKNLKFNGALKYFYEIRNFIIDVLQLKNYSLDKRLAILAVFVRELEKLIKNLNIDTIPELLQNTVSKINNGEIDNIINSIVVPSQVQLADLNEIIQYNFTFVHQKQYMMYVSEFLTGISYSKDVLFEVIEKNYVNSYDEYLKPFLNEYGYILENYMVNDAFKNVIPFGETISSNVFEEFYNFVLKYSIIKMLLTGIGAYRKGITPEHVIDLISVFTISVDHSKVYMVEALKKLRNKGLLNLEGLIYLLK
ncbi:flagellin lysine-N-methylase [Clostridium ljungdahlii]|uniref:Flagellar biosynthetic protein FliU n=1 Tax=Clostridium ljungdahlii TaxID=1538 RepID=A0A170NBE5_9CLOT|nr:flagellin lysine-N-methylase [Clostridium ljungdahlii]OAA83185.1 Flagellar biosynthetic protein FliU [Clostridium ljungdahlii]